MLLIFKEIRLKWKYFVSNFVFSVRVFKWNLSKEKIFIEFIGYFWQLNDFGVCKKLTKCGSYDVSFNVNGKRIKYIEVLNGILPMELHSTSYSNHTQMKNLCKLSATFSNTVSYSSELRTVKVTQVGGVSIFQTMLKMFQIINGIWIKIAKSFVDLISFD